MATKKKSETTEADQAEDQTVSETTEADQAEDQTVSETTEVNQVEDQPAAEATEANQDEDLTSTEAAEASQAEDQPTAEAAEDSKISDQEVTMSTDAGASQDPTTLDGTEGAEAEPEDESADLSELQRMLQIMVGYPTVNPALLCKLEDEGMVFEPRGNGGYVVSVAGVEARGGPTAAVAVTNWSNKARRVLRQKGEAV